MREELTKILRCLMDGRECDGEIFVGDYSIRVAPKGCTFVCYFYYKRAGIGFWDNYDRALLVFARGHKATIEGAVRDAGAEIVYY